MSLDAYSKLLKIEKEVKNLKKMFRSRERFFRAAGGWIDIDAEKLKKNVFEARGISDRGRVELE